MQIILLQDVKKVGKKGEIKKVSDGYARNFLFPKKLAEVATKDSIQSHKVLQQNTQKTKEKERENFTDLAEKLRNYSVTISMNAKDGKLFGSVGEKEIVETLKKGGFMVAEEHVQLEKHIKEVGDVTVKILFPYGVESSVQVSIKEK